ncbi:MULTISPECIES: hypothetical protein [unclassified Legionella]|uniref:hypothetical protein n=1 Tax=unclassified Legionella TaxID=2622702 RepID=UPI001055C9E5|nr:MULTISPECIES: hypothetical protein [unclassified Legionella]MDI9818469.1 hypothetical protein [Legionella sp. PL877]
MKKSPTQKEISATVKTGLGSLPTDSGIPWVILQHSHYRDVSSEKAEQKVKEEKRLQGVLFRKSSIEGYMAITALDNNNSPVKFILSNQELNKRIVAYKYYMINMGDVIIDSVHDFLSMQCTDKFEDFILRKLDDKITETKEARFRSQKECAKIYIVEEDSYPTQISMS